MSNDYEHRFANINRRLDSHSEDIKTFREHVIRCDERQEQRLEEERKDRKARQDWEKRLDRYIRWGGGFAVVVILSAIGFSRDEVIKFILGV